MRFLELIACLAFIDWEASGVLFLEVFKGTQGISFGAYSHLQESPLIVTELVSGAGEGAGPGAGGGAGQGTGYQLS